MVFNIGDIFLQWQMAGIFEFLLPALLIFAIVYGILNTTNIITKEKSIQIIISIIISCSTRLSVCCTKANVRVKS